MAWAPPTWARAPTGAPSLPAPDTAASRRVRLDPRLLSALVLVALIFVVGFRQQISQSIGTAGTAPLPLPAHALFVPAVPVVELPRPSQVSTPVPAYAPRDPFLSMSVKGSTMAAAAVTSSTRVDTSAYRVRAGDSLWAIARRSLGAHASDATIATTWRRIYADNRTVVGPNPSRLPAGSVLRLPALP
jgi:nucleoid-associated protein YgaU